MTQRSSIAAAMVFVLTLTAIAIGVAVLLAASVDHVISGLFAGSGAA